MSSQPKGVVAAGHPLTAQEGARALRQGGHEVDAAVGAMLTTSDADLLTSTPECAALWAPDGRVLEEGELLRNGELADALTRLGEDGAEPFYRGDVALAVCDWLAARGGSLSRGDLAGYAAIARPPVRVPYRDREVLTNPPPSAGGILLAYALALLDRGPAP